MAGLSYPSFNNFSYEYCADGIDGDGDGTVDEYLDVDSGGFACIWDHPTISREHQEHKFLLVRNCGQDGSCDENWFANQISGVSPGDILEFELYFHNNGDDPYDPGSQSSPNAIAPYLGLDLTNPSHPIGFIFAYNAEYRMNKNDPSSAITFKSGDYTFGLADYQPGVGDIANTISDDVSILGLGNMKLELIPNNVALDSRYGDDVFWHGLVPTNNQGGADITYTTPSAGNKSIYMAHFDDPGKLISFLFLNELPGCYRYSGKVYFRAIVVPGPDKCTDVDILRRTPVTFYDEDYDQWRDGYKIDYNYIFDPAAPPGVELAWETSNQTGHFFKKNLSTGKFYRADKVDEYALDDDSANDDDYTIPLGHEVYYAEYGGSSSIYVKVNRNTYNGEIATACNDKLVPDLLCEDLTITNTQSVDIDGTPGLKIETDVSWKERTPEGLVVDSYEIPSGTKLKWTSGDTNGQFYFKFDNSYVDVDMTPSAGGVQALMGIEKTVYYTGNGPVTVTVDADSYNHNDSHIIAHGDILPECADQLAIDQNYCISLTASKSPVGNPALEYGDGYYLNIDAVQFQEQLDFIDNLKYRWELVDGQGSFWMQYQSGMPYTNYGENPPVVTKDQNIVFVGTGTIRVSIDDPRITELGIDVSGCVYPLTIDVEPNLCIEPFNVEISEIFNPYFAPNQYAYKLDETNVEWLREGVNPDDIRFTWTTDDPNGEFWYETSPGDPIEIEGGGFASTLFKGFAGNDVSNIEMDWEVYYVGSGNIGVTITGNNNIPPEWRNPDVCKWEHYIPPNECVDLKINAVESHVYPGGEEIRTIEMAIEELNFLKTMPENIMIKWSSDDPDGIFWYETFGFEGEGNFYLQFPDRGGYILTYPEIPKVHFQGEGTITAEVVLTDGNFNIIDSDIDLTACRDFVITPICYDLKLNHPGTIYVNTVSSFAGRAIDTVGDEQGTSSRKIIYEVDDGYGFFYTQDPGDAYLTNSSDMVFEIIESGMETAATLLEQWVQANEGFIVFEIIPAIFEAQYIWIPEQDPNIPVGWATFFLPEDIQQGYQAEIAQDVIGLNQFLLSGQQAEYQSMLGKMDGIYYEEIIRNDLWNIPLEDLLGIMELQIQNPAFDQDSLTQEQLEGIVTQLLSIQGAQQTFEQNLGLTTDAIFNQPGSSLDPGVTETMEGFEGGFEGGMLGNNVLGANIFGPSFGPAGANNTGIAPRYIAQAADPSGGNGTGNPVQAPPGGVTSLVVDPETVVYFFATQASTQDVIHIYAEGTESTDPTCSRHFPIASAPADCSNLVAYIDGLEYAPGRRLEADETYEFSADATYTNGDIYQNTITYIANAGILIDGQITSWLWDAMPNAAELVLDSGSTDYHQVLTKNEGEIVTFWTFSEDYIQNTLGTYLVDDALEINATGFYR
ncbi:hypothetical protein ACFL21_05140 [Patescibacteria group bacterium]